MSSVGLVGGLGPESTIDPTTAPAIVIDSLDVQRALHLVEHDRPALTEYLASSVQRLARTGVDFVAMTANTAHIVFDEVAARSPVPLLSIVEVCAEEARARGLRRVALLGTRFTMDARFYPDVCARYGIAVVSPNERDLQTPVVAGLPALDTTALHVAAIVERLRRRDAAPSH